MGRTILIFRKGITFSFEKRKGYGTEYEVNYYQINVGEERFAELIRAACGVDTKEEESDRIREIYAEDIVLSEETAQEEGVMEERLAETAYTGKESEEAIGENVTEEMAEADGSGAWQLLRAVAYAALAVCVTGFLFLVVQRIVRKRRYRRMDVTGRFRILVSANMRILRMLGFRRDRGETLQEFRERIVDERGCADCGLRFIEDYEKILYGDKKAGPDMLQNAVEEKKALIKVLKEKKGWRYFLYFFLLLSKQYTVEA